MSVNVGDKAPDFKLKSHNLDNISLSDYAGKKNVVILFFPLVNTSVCEKELIYTSEDIMNYQNADAQVLAISVDSPFSQKLWAEKHNFKFPLLSDFNKETAKKYDAFYELYSPGRLDYNGVAKRSAFVIDKEGIIRYAEVLENPGEEPDYDAIKETLKKLES